MKSGDKVMCLADRFRFEDPALYEKLNLPKKLIEYTVDKFVVTPYGTCITLVELPNEKVLASDGTMQELLFGTNRFERL
jgi:hypothetical protein